MMHEKVALFKSAYGGANVQDTTLFSYWSSVKSEIDDAETGRGPSVDGTAGGSSVDGPEHGTASGSDHGTDGGSSVDGP